MILRIGSRDSKLALTQTEIVCEKILSENPHLSNHNFQIIKIKTKGDKILDKNLNEIGGKNLFIKEIESALLENTIDFAVHSLKDMTGKMPSSLMIGAHIEREDPRDAFVSFKYKSLQDLPKNSILGTSSVRRKYICLKYRSDLRIIPFRGNVQTRLEKLEQNQADATFLAMAGLNRLNIDNKIFTPLSVDYFLPAVSQGIIGVQCRKSDKNIINLLSTINHTQTEIVTKAERAFLEYLDADCSAPIAGYAQIDQGQISLECLAINSSGTIMKDYMIASVDKAQELGLSMGKKFKPFLAL